MNKWQNNFVLSVSRWGEICPFLNKDLLEKELKAAAAAIHNRPLLYTKVVFPALKVHFNYPWQTKKIKLPQF